MIPFTDFGGAGQKVHFLHANGYPPLCYEPLIELLKSKYQISAMHLRPLWAGSNPLEIKAWHPLSDDLALYLEEQQDPRAIVIGHSVGAIITLRAAIRAPEMFKAIVLIDPVLFSPRFILTWNITKMLGLGTRLHPLIPFALNRRRKFDDLNRLFLSYRRKTIFRFFSDSALKAYINGIVKPAQPSGFELVYSPEWEAQIYLSGVWKDLDLWRGLPGLKVPTLIIRGDETDTFLSATAEKVKQRRPATTIVSIEKSTHLVPMERPQETFQAIETFLEELK